MALRSWARELMDIICLTFQNSHWNCPLKRSYEGREEVGRGSTPNPAVGRAGW